MTDFNPVNFTEKELQKCGVNIYDINHVTDVDRLDLAYKVMSDYNDLQSDALTDELDIACSYICYLSELLDRAMNRLNNLEIDYNELYHKLKG